jgi:hypothetical protein
MLYEHTLQLDESRWCNTSGRCPHHPECIVTGELCEAFSKPNPPSFAGRLVSRCEPKDLLRRHDGSEAVLLEGCDDSEEIVS